MSFCHLSEVVFIYTVTSIFTSQESGESFAATFFIVEMRERNSKTTRNLFSGCKYPAIKKKK